MKTLTLQRRFESKDGTLGELLEPELKCIEEEDRNNERGESRIPAGEYLLVPSRYHKGGYDTYEIVDLPGELLEGRTRLLFHVGNTEEDLNGCIAPGLEWGKLKVPDEDGGGVMREKIAVLQSKAGFKTFMAWCDGDENIRFIVKDIWPDAPPPDLALVDTIEDGRGLR